MANSRSPLPTGRFESRRRLLRAASGAAAAVAAVGFPTVARGQSGPVRMRWQSAWGANDVLQGYAQDFAGRVGDITGGELKIQILPAGAVVPAPELLDAVSKGALDGAHTAVVNQQARNSAFALWGSGPAYGMDANTLLAWHRYGGGEALLAKIHAAIGADVVGILYGPLFTQPLGWFKRPIGKSEDLRGLKLRTGGPALDLFAAMGASAASLPDAELAAALAGGAVDAVAFRDLSSDRRLGLAGVAKLCMLQSYHRNAEQLELLFNRPRYAALPGGLRAALATAADAASAELSWKTIDRNSSDYIELRVKDQVKFYKTPDPVLQKELEVYDQLAAKEASANPLFREVAESQRAFAARAVRWDMDNNVNRRLAFDHYFGPKPAARGKT
ncbi:MAG: C4-dicarboxylate ABC transporter [Betaproteobacteria bacterium]